MNSDSESLQNQLLRWLLAETAEPEDYTSVNCEENNGVDKFANCKPGVTDNISGLSSADSIPQTFQLGEIPTVQERFQAVLKRRLKTHIQNHPPLFPWESQLVDYPEYVENSSMALAPIWGWSAQQSLLNLPTNLPEKVFQQLLEKCQALVASSIPLGTKLVRAVESLFPQEPQAINDLAGLVLRTPYRSINTLANMPILEQDYSDLQERQQMALSLIAAQKLLENLTLEISTTQPVVERQWLTSAGSLNLRAESIFQDGVTALRVCGDLPHAGSMTLRENNSNALAQATGSDRLTLELPVSTSGQVFMVEVSLDILEEAPLMFVVKCFI